MWSLRGKDFWSQWNNLATHNFGFHLRFGTWKSKENKHESRGTSEVYYGIQLKILRMYHNCKSQKLDQICMKNSEVWSLNQTVKNWKPKFHSQGHKPKAKILSYGIQARLIDSNTLDLWYGLEFKKIILMAQHWYLQKEVIFYFFLSIGHGLQFSWIFFTFFKVTQTYSIFIDTRNKHLSEPHFRVNTTLYWNFNAFTQDREKLFQNFSVAAQKMLNFWYLQNTSLVNNIFFSFF